MTIKRASMGRRAPRSWLITALLASLAVAYVAFVFGPAQARIGTLRSQLNERRQHILQGSGLIVPLDHAKSHLAKTRLVSADWKQAAPGPDEVSNFFARLSAEARAAGVVIEKFDPQPPVEMLALSQHGVAIHFHGQFREVFDFVRRVEQLPGSVWIPSLRVNSDNRASSILRGELNLTIFVDRSDSPD
jgi:Tfp pilus assembly protein PilO